MENDRDDEGDRERDEGEEAPERVRGEESPELRDGLGGERVERHEDDCDAESREEQVAGQSDRVASASWKNGVPRAAAPRATAANRGAVHL